MANNISIYSTESKKRLTGKAKIDMFWQQVGKRAMKAVKRGVIRAGKEAFNHSMNMVPYDTGQLAKSARISVNNTTIGQGTFEGVPRAEFFDSKISSIINKQGDKAVTLRISFRRLNTKGEDITPLLHELGPQGSSSIQARHGRTGKFIETPLMQVSARIKTYILDSFK